MPKSKRAKVGELMSNVRYAGCAEESDDSLVNKNFEEGQIEEGGFAKTGTHSLRGELLLVVD